MFFENVVSLSIKSNHANDEQPHTDPYSENVWPLTFTPPEDIKVKCVSFSSQPSRAAAPFEAALRRTPQQQTARPVVISVLESLQASGSPAPTVWSTHLMSSLTARGCGMSNDNHFKMSKATQNMSAIQNWTNRQRTKSLFFLYWKNFLSLDASLIVESWRKVLLRDRLHEAGVRRLGKSRPKNWGFAPSLTEALEGRALPHVQTLCQTCGFVSPGLTHRLKGCLTVWDLV